MVDAERSRAAVSELAAHPASRAGAVARLWRADPAAAELIALVASARGIALADLLQKSRCRAEIAGTRQLAMYLTHVTLGRTLSEVAALFGRDRTTASYACGLIEDRREGRFDEEVSRLEEQIGAMLDRCDQPARAARHVAS